MNRGGPASFVKERETRELLCRLTDPEVQQCTDDCMHALAEIERVEQERSTANAGFKEALGELRSTVSAQSRKVRERAEYRDVECEWWIHPHEGNAELVRPDTGEVLRTRPLTKEERQGNLFPLPSRIAARSGADFEEPPADPPTEPRRRRRRRKDDDQGEPDTES